MRFIIVVLGVLVGLVPQAWAEEYGNFEGQFVLEGEAPPQPVPVKVGVPMCVAGIGQDESVIVNPKSKGIANIFVYLAKAPAPINPALQASKTPEVVFDNMGCRFVPHAAVVRTDQKVRFTNSDGTPHNIHTYTFGNPQQNFLLAANDRKGTAIAVKMRESLPMPVKCDIHPRMRGTMLIVDHPYAVVTDDDGKFRIDGLPAGEHSFRVWHENPGYVDRAWKVKIVGGKTTTLPTVQVPVSSLKAKSN